MSLVSTIGIFAGSRVDGGWRLHRKRGREGELGLLKLLDFSTLGPVRRSSDGGAGLASWMQCVEIWDLGVKRLH